MKAYGKKIALLLIAVLLFTQFFCGVQVNHAMASTTTLQELASDTVSYYKDNKTSLTHWQEVMGLSSVGETVYESPWSLPGWNIESLGAGSSAADYAGAILGLLAAGQDPTNYGGRNLAQELAGKQTGSGDFGGAINDTIWAMIALDSASQNYGEANAVNHLISRQKADGGFAYSGSTGEPDMTGMALMALAGKQGTGAAIGAAINYFKSVQLDTAGFALGGEENAESIAAVIWGLTACGEDVTENEWKKNGRTMIHALMDFRLGNGSFSHLRGGPGNAMATRQALMAMGYLLDAGISFEYNPGGSGDSPGGEASVRVRVEGAAGSLADETVTVSGTALDALKEAVGEANISDGGGFVSAILGVDGSSAVPGMNSSWLYYVIRNGQIDPTAFDSGAGDFDVRNGDQVIFYIGAFDQSWTCKTYLPVVTVSPADPAAGQALTVSIGAKKYEWGSGIVDLTPEEKAAIGDYTVAVNGSQLTSRNGQVIISGAAQGEMSFTVTNASEAGYPDVVTYKGAVAFRPAGGGGGGTGNQIQVTVKVTGRSGETLYPSTVRTFATGTTALVALKNTGLNVIHTSDGFVTGIEGQYNAGQEGWKYSINGAEPNICAGDCRLHSGDSMYWYWGSASSTGPQSSAGNKNETGPVPASPQEQNNQLPQGLRVSGDAIRALSTISSRLGVSGPGEAIGRLAEAAMPVVVVGAQQNLSPEELSRLRQELAANRVAIRQAVKPEEGAVITDRNAEIALAVPANALGEQKEITVEEISPAELGAPSGEIQGEGPPQGFMALTPVYRMGPAGLRFGKPVTVSIKVTLPPGIAPENLIFSWHDPHQKAWLALPAVFDAGNSVIIAQISHFSRYAVMAGSLPEAGSPPLPAVKSFTDLEGFEWAREAIETLAGRGIVSGVDTERFEPGRTVTRAEFVTMLARLKELSPADGNYFSDVQSRDWFGPYVYAAYKAGLIRGYQDGTFRPGQPVTREEMAVMLDGAFNWGLTSVEPGFKDRDRLSPWAVDGGKGAVRERVISGYGDGTFRPWKEANRAEASVMLFKVLP